MYNEIIYIECSKQTITMKHSNIYIAHSFQKLEKK